jgi:hypothetical protein
MDAVFVRGFTAGSVEMDWLEHGSAVFGGKKWSYEVSIIHVLSGGHLASTIPALSSVCLSLLA